jgi:hypothetical protein
LFRANNKLIRRSANLLRPLGASGGGMPNTLVAEMAAMRFQPDNLKLLEAPSA